MIGARASDMRRLLRGTAVRPKGIRSSLSNCLSDDEVGGGQDVAELLSTSFEPLQLYCHCHGGRRLYIITIHTTNIYSCSVDG
eukprot:scaffold478742_cov18-Prasinocladus_malaysianus.AAC.1